MTGHAHRVGVTGLHARRRAGALLPIASLGADPLGAPARRFVDWLAAAGFGVWQMLPVGPAGPDGSPYWVSSDHALDPSFLPPGFDAAAFARDSAHELRTFRERAAPWLADFALHAALAGTQQGGAWTGWPAPLRDREPATLAQARARHAEELVAIEAQQCALDLAWRALREYAASRGVALLGDLPIYVAPDSVETWAHREQFRLDASGRPTAVAGVPPDYFSADGQLWGNPLYDWGRAGADGFRHFRSRVATQLERFDALRIDHFRALAAHWEVPAGAATARDGRWVDTPGQALLESLAREHPTMPFVAEDLGVITDDVNALRERFGLPGMHVLQFGFDGAPDNPHLPHMHRRDAVVYTGTHDNDTTAGWVGSLDGETLRRVEFYFGTREHSLVEAMQRAALGSVAQLAVIPVPDLLGLGSEARINTPGTVTNNWCWRLDPEALTAARADRWRLLNRTFARA